jgi:hypothetical protein
MSRQTRRWRLEYNKGATRSLSQKVALRLAPSMMFLGRDWRGPMGIEISRDTELRLATEARRLGISVDALVDRLITERAALTHRSQPRPGLPVWHLGGVGALHRRDLYDDVR